MSQISREQTVEPKTLPGQRLHPDAAAAWDRAVTEHNAARPILVTDSHRPYDVQERIFRQRYRQGNYRGKPGFSSASYAVKYWNGQPWTLLAGQASAATPGTSNHGSGMAVDIKTRRSASDPGSDKSIIWNAWNDPDRVSFLKIASKHGWADTEGRAINEVWHLTYYPSKDQYRGKTTPTAAVKMLQRGDQGEQVEALQRALNQAKTTNPKLKIDGDFGTKTEAAVRAFQQALGLTVDGIVGPKTRAAMADHGIGF